EDRLGSPELGRAGDADPAGRHDAVVTPAEPGPVSGSQRLAGKVAVVTGAGSGIGRGIARRFVAEGAQLLVTDLEIDRAAATAESIEGGRSIPFRLDVAVRADHEAALAAAIARFRPVDVR